MLVKEKVKRNSYIFLGDEEDGIEDLERVIECKNLGIKTMQLLNKRISCIQGIGDSIDESYGLDYSEILDLLEEFYDYKIIDRKDMVESYNYTLLDICYNWEMYAQNNDYAEECNVLEVEGLRKKLEEMLDNE